jgi:hypothetical protein
MMGGANYPPERVGLALDVYDFDDKKLRKVVALFGFYD